MKILNCIKDCFQQCYQQIFHKSKTKNVENKIPPPPQEIEKQTLNNELEKFNISDMQDKLDLLLNNAYNKGIGDELASNIKDIFKRIEINNLSKEYKKPSILSNEENTFNEYNVDNNRMELHNQALDIMAETPGINYEQAVLQSLQC